MKIVIDDNRTIDAVQRSFNKLFPFLKIKFLVKPNTSSGTHPHAFITDTSLRISDCRTIHKKGKLTILPGMTVNEIEQHFSDTFGIAVRIFRKSGRMWLETKQTRGWTLEMQNSQGETLSSLSENYATDKDHQ